MKKADLLLAGAAALALHAAAHAEALPEALAGQVRQLALDASKSASTAAARVDVKVGEIDPRLKLAPCDDVQPYLPPGARLWGRTRIGLRCIAGPTRWNVYLPLTVSVYARALVAAGPLPAGAVLQAGDLHEAEVDIAAEPGTAIARADAALGRALARPLVAGAALRATDLRPRVWFDAGDSVRIVAVGAGYAVSAEGQALSPGVEGRSVRVRTESGRVVTGQAVAERRVEVPL